MEIIIEKKKQLAKICRVKIQGNQFLTPIFFPAISSTENEYSDHYNWLIKQKPEIFMSSAYDLDAKKLKQISKLKSITYLDGGGYELKNSQDPKRWTIEDQIEIIKRSNFEMIITIDSPIHKKFSRKYSNVRNEILINNYEIIEETVKKNSIICFSITEDNFEEIIKQIRMIFSRINPKVISIPEDNLGVTFDERIISLRKISEILSDVSNNDILIHIRGCSEPDSIIQYVENGADIFDGLGWTRKVIKWIETDREKIPDIYSKWYLDQERGKLSDCSCNECKKNRKKDYLERLFAHNLEAYKTLINEIHVHINSS